MHKKEETIIGRELNLHETRFVEISWTDDLEFEPKLFDCSFDDAMEGLDVYALCLNSGFLTNEKNILFYNNFSNIDNSLLGDYGYCYLDYPGFDQCFTLIPNQLATKYDEILFLIGRPQSREPKNKSWINKDLLKDAVNEKCYISVTIKKISGESYTIKNIKYDYNIYGAMVLFGFKKNNNLWSLNISHDFYLNGLSEIIEKLLKSGTNSV